MALGSKLREARLKMNLTTSQVAAATRMKVQIVEALEREDFRQIAAPIYGKGFIKLYAESVGLSPKSLIDEYMRLLGSPPAPSLVTEESHPPKPATLRPELAALETDKYTPTTGEAVTVKTEEFEPKSATAPEPIAPAPAIEEARPHPAPNLAEDLELFAHAEAKAAKSARAEAPDEAPDEFRYHAIRKKPEEPEDLWTKRASAGRAGATPAEEDREKDGGPPTRFGFGPFPLRTVSIVAGVLIVLACLVSGMTRCTKHPARAAVAPRSSPSPSKPLRTALPLPEPYVD